MKPNFYLYSLVVFILTACQTQKNGTSINNNSKIDKKKLSNIGKSIYLQIKHKTNILQLEEGEDKFLQEQQMNVTFLKTIQDNRCPMNSNCAWTENTSVEIELMTTSSRPMRYTLSIGNLRGKMLNSVDFSGYKISLEKLFIEETFEKPKGKYIIVLKIEELTNQ